MNKRNEVLGTCGVEMEFELGAARPDLDFHLSKVTADGLPYDCGYTRINGSGLKALIDAQQDRCQEDLRIPLEKKDQANNHGSEVR